MIVNAPSRTSNFSTETNFDYNTTTSWVTENSKRKIKLVENASISNSETTATLQEYTFTGKYYNIYVSKKACTNKELISFSVNGVNYIAEKNMTWSEWVESSYDSKGIIIKDSDVYHDDICFVYTYINDAFHYVKSNETIIDKMKYSDGICASPDPEI